MSDIGEDYKTAPRSCPNCGAGNTGHFKATGQAPGGPKPGDVSICVYCGAVAVYGPRGRMEPAPAEVLADPDVQAMVRLVQQNRQRSQADQS